MIKPAEKIPLKPSNPKFLIITRYCEKCMVAIRWQKVPTQDGFPICPKCSTHLYLGTTNKMRIKL